MLSPEKCAIDRVSINCLICALIALRLAITSVSGVFEDVLGVDLADVSVGPLTCVFADAGTDVLVDRLADVSTDLFIEVLADVLSASDCLCGTRCGLATNLPPCFRLFCLRFAGAVSLKPACIIWSRSESDMVFNIVVAEQRLTQASARQRLTY